MTQFRTETSPASLYGRLPASTASRVPQPGAEPTLDDLLVAWEEIERLEGCRDGLLARGCLETGPSLSTGSANPLAAFTGRGLIPAGWRQGRGTIDPTGANNGLIWEMIKPGDTGDLLMMARTITYAAGLTMTFTPTAHGGIPTISLVAGVARALAVVPATYSATITYIAGTTTYAEILADWNASAAALALAVLTGDAGTIPATFEGGVLYLNSAVLVQYIPNGGATAVAWDAPSRTVTVGLDIAGAGDSVANVLVALAASATGAQYVVQTRNLYGSSGAGNIVSAGFCQLIGGTAKAMRKASLVMAQGNHKDLVFERRAFGSDAPVAYVAFVNDALVEPPTVAVTDHGTHARIDVTGKAGTATALHIRQALRDSPEAMELISVRLKSWSNGSGTPAAFASTALSDGSDSDAVEVSAGTVAATGVTALTDDGFTVDFAALGALHPAASLIPVRARICGVVHELTVHVVT